MQVPTIAICSNPDCTRHAAATTPGGIPARCPTCGAPMFDRCWKCEASVTDPFSSYCAHCGVPLKRILPRHTVTRTVIAICANPECDGAVEATTTSALLSRCPKCRTALISHCGKCGARVVDPLQRFCQVCGVSLKLQQRVVADRGFTSITAVNPTPGTG